MAHSAVGVTIHKSLLELCDALNGILRPTMGMFFFGNIFAEAVDGNIKMAFYVIQ
jgi:adenosylmethionine-8-amino-7-oxononanoate aminotransferase